MRFTCFLSMISALALSGLPSLSEEVYLLEPLSAERVIVAKGGYFPRLLQRRNGELIATFKTNAPHIGKGGRASMSRSKDGGRTWSSPVTVFDKPDADDSTDSLGELPDGTLLFAAVSYTWPGERYTHVGWRADTYTIESKDGGETWSAPRRVNTAPLTWSYPFGRIVRLQDGTLLLSGFGGYLPILEQEWDLKPSNRPDAPHKPEDKIGQFCYLVRSHDNGKTWGELSILGRHFNEVTIMPLKNGSLLAVMRSEQGGHLSSAFSSDQGRTWSAPKQVTADREHPGDLLRLANGDILLSFGERNKPYGVRAILSHDEGRTWDTAHPIMLAWDGDHGDLGYAISAQRPDGRIVTLYYIVYGERDPQGLKGFAPANAFIKGVIWDLPKR